MSKKVLTFLAVVGLGCVAHGDLWINEIHYDDASGDANEGIEVVLTGADVGIDLTTVTVSLYNGSNGLVYNTATLDTFTAGDTGTGYAIFSLAIAGIQNGAPDGMSLDIGGTLVAGQFLSYEGSLLAAGGPADTLNSTDIGVAEGGATLDTDSLQLAGTGSTYADHTWQTEAASTFGSLNAGQAIPEPSTLALLGLGVLGLFGARRKVQS